MPPLSAGREHAADQRHRQGDEGQRRPAAELPNDACSSRKIAASGADGQQQDPVLRGLPLLVLAEQLGVVCRAGTARPSSLGWTSADDRAEVAALDVGGDVDAALSRSRA